MTTGQCNHRRDRTIITTACIKHGLGFSVIVSGGIVSGTQGSLLQAHTREVEQSLSGTCA